MTPRTIVAVVALAALVRADPDGASAATAPPAPRALETSPPPPEQTPSPKLDEWRTAPAVTLARPLPATCRAQLLREWLRIRCTTGFHLPATGAVLGGSRDGVAFFMSTSFTSASPSDRFIEVIMPLRRGDRRLVQLTQGGESDYGIFFSQELLLLVSEDWPEGAPGPVVTTTPLPKTGPIRGMRLGTAEEAKALGVSKDPFGTVVLEVAPGSVAERGGAKVGDEIALTSLERIHQAAEDADRLDLSVPMGGGHVINITLGPTL